MPGNQSGHTAVSGAVVAALLLAALALLGALATHAHDPAPQPIIAWAAQALVLCLGRPAFLLPAVLLMPCWLLFRGLSADHPAPLQAGRRFIGFVLGLLASCALASLYWPDWPSSGRSAGGTLGAALGRDGLQRHVGPLAATGVLLALWLTGVLLFFNTSWLKVSERLGAWAFGVLGLGQQGAGIPPDKAPATPAPASLPPPTPHIRSATAAIRPRRTQTQTDLGSADPLYDEAVRIVTTERKPAIAYLQRRLQIGYKRAAYLLESMEREGLVGPPQANGRREILGAAPQSGTR